MARETARARPDRIWHARKVVSLVPGLGTRTIEGMLKGEDIVLLLKLASSVRDDWTVRDLEVTTTIPKSSVQRSLERLNEAGLLKPDNRAARMAQAEEFLLHGMRYVFPAPLGAATRGIPAAWAAEPLVAQFPDAAELPPVWPHLHGPIRGQALEPLHRTAINAAAKDPNLGELLALVDGMRAGDARIRGVASEMLSDRLKRVRG
jgi:hypothetical protein